MVVSPLRSTVSSTEDPSGRAALIAALEVKRNLKRGLAVGLSLTALVFLVFVVLPPDTVRSPAYYIALGFVLALTTGGLAAAVLVAHRAYRLADDL